MNVFVYADNAYPADVRDRILGRLREKHPSARVQRLDAGKADRILCFGPEPDFVRYFRKTGTPTVIYAADGAQAVYDENLFVATLVAELDASEVTHRIGPRRHAARGSFDERRNTSGVFPAAPGSADAAVEVSRAWQAEQAAKAAEKAADDQLTIEQATAKRDEAMQRVDENADEAWKAVADHAILVTASKLDTFTGDDVWISGGLPPTRENRALGPRITTAARRGLIEKTGEFRPSVRSNMTPRHVWRITEKGRAALAAD